MRPADSAAVTLALTPLGDKVVDTPNTVLVSGIPVLYGGIFDVCIVKRDKFNNRCVQLVFVSHWRGAALKVTDASAFFGDDERAFELPR